VATFVACFFVVKEASSVGLWWRAAQQPAEPSATSGSPLVQEQHGPRERVMQSHHQVGLVVRTLEADQVVQLVQDPASGMTPRPQNIEGDLSACVGRIFRECTRVGKRKKGSDTWIAKGGQRGGRTLISSCGRAVRQLYGKATLRGHKLTSAVVTPKSLVFHVWTVSGTDQRLYHIVSDGRQRQQRVGCTGMKDGEVAQLEDRVRTLEDGQRRQQRVGCTGMKDGEVAQLKDRVRTLENVVALLLERQTPQLNALLNLANPSSTTGSTISDK
jgi:hypothetical protein